MRRFRRLAEPTEEAKVDFLGKLNRRLAVLGDVRASVLEDLAALRRATLLSAPAPGVRLGAFQGAAMGGSPSPSPVVQPPVVDKDVVNREADDLARRRRGRAATQLAGDPMGNLGATGAPAQSVAVKQLLGS